MPGSWGGRGGEAERPGNAGGRFSAVGSGGVASEDGPGTGVTWERYFSGRISWFSPYV